MLTMLTQVCPLFVLIYYIMNGGFTTEVGTASEVTASELDTSCLDSESDAMRLQELMFSSGQAIIYFIVV